MYTLMDSSTKCTTYYFTPNLGQPNGYMQLQDIYAFDKDGMWLEYGGKANYVQGTGSQYGMIVDWTQDKPKYFGFMMVWSTNLLCRTATDKDTLNFGEQFTTDVNGAQLIDQTGDLYRVETRVTSVATPQKQLYYINQDLAEDVYKVTLNNFLSNVNSNGYDMFYKDWNKAGYIYNIKGFDWIKKYNSTDVVVSDRNRTGDISLVVYGLTGLVNSGATGVVWSFFIADSIKTNKYYVMWYGWFIIFLVHLILWAPITILWPLSYIGDINVIRLFDTWVQIAMYGGTYGGYQVGLILIILGMGWNFDGGWIGTVAIAWGIIIGYLAEATLTAFLSFWFYPQFSDWILVQEELEALRVEDQKKNNGGTIVVAQNTANGPIIFDNGSRTPPDGTTIDTTQTTDPTPVTPVIQVNTTATNQTDTAIKRRQRAYIDF